LRQFIPAKPMNGEEIACILGVTKQRISQELTVIIGKLYNQTLYIHQDKSPILCFGLLIDALERWSSRAFCANEIKRIYRMLPNEYKKDPELVELKSILDEI
jgi:hypothetical protein